jgi:hypothetical protein
MTGRQDLMLGPVTGLSGLALKAPGRPDRRDCAPRQDLDQARCVMSGAMAADE